MAAVGTFRQVRKWRERGRIHFALLREEVFLENSSPETQQVFFLGNFVACSLSTLHHEYFFINLDTASNLAFAKNICTKIF
jgi:hypothetical protein